MSWECRENRLVVASGCRGESLGAMSDLLTILVSVLGIEKNPLELILLPLNCF